MRFVRTIRGRLAIWYGAALALVLIAYAGTVFAFLRQRLHAELDGQLHETFGRAGEDLRHADGTWPSELRLEFWSPEGRLVRSRGPDALAPPPPTPEEVEAGRRAATVHLAGGGSARALTGPFSFGGTPGVLRVVRSEDRLHHELAELLLGMGIGLPLAVALAVAGGYLLARRALAPVARMAEQAKAITADRLADRLPVGNPEDEIGRLATVFNETLTRLERSFGVLRRFTADAAHELRTPLAAVRSVGEVGLLTARDQDALRDVIGSMLEEIDRLTGFVDALLSFSRADAGQLAVDPEEIDLPVIAAGVCDLLSVLAEEKNLAVAVECRGAVRVRADPRLIRRALLNLLDNAIRHSPAGGRIRIPIRRDAGSGVLEVIDEGPGIPRELQDRVFERFFRVDPARSRDRGGTGLGLAIARLAVEANAGRLELESAPGAGCLFRVVLPLLRV